MLCPKTTICYIITIHIPINSLYSLRVNAHLISLLTKHAKDMKYKIHLPTDLYATKSFNKSTENSGHLKNTTQDSKNLKKLTAPES
jgi:hypothetical protein